MSDAQTFFEQNSSLKLMPKRPPTYGDESKKRVRCLLEKLLAYANNELTDSKLEIDLEWQNKNQVIVRTNLRVLENLTNLTKEKAGLTKEQVREALKQLENFLGILEDLREHKRGSEHWHFKLTLWHEKDEKQENLQKFDAEWQRLREQKPGVQRTEKRTTKSAPTSYHNLPNNGVVEFVGRNEELEQIHEKLQQNHQVAITAIAGMGGVGKTELALQYALKHLKTYPGGICWLLASRNVGLQVVQLAERFFNLKPPEDLKSDLSAQVGYCWQRWHEGKVLLVMDNVTDYKEVKPYLPLQPSPRFKVLITTREEMQKPIDKLDLNVLKPLAAMNLLKSLVGRKRLQREPWVAKELCKWLGYLPLGLELVGRYLAVDEDLCLKEMLERLKEKSLQDKALAKTRSEMTAERGVAAAFELSWQRLKENENAQFLGCLLSLFALAPIPWQLLDSVVQNTENEPKDLNEARHALLQLHLLQRKKEKIYQLHPLLREFFQAKLAASQQADDLKRGFVEAMVAIAKTIPYPPTVGFINSVKDAIPHLAEVAQNLTDAVSKENFYWFFTGLGLFYQGQGLYALAQPWLEQCVSVVQSHLGEEHPDVAACYSNLALLYRDQGRYSEAESLSKKALELRQRLLGEEHPDVASSYNNLAELYLSQGRYSEAEPLSKKALELRQRLLGEEHPDVAASYNNLASLYEYQGRYSEAETLYQKALELRQRLLGEEHPDVAASYNNLALLYNIQERYSEAEPLHIKALELWKRLLGEEHPAVATSYNNLGALYNDQGRYSEAEPLHIKALELWKRLLGEEHPLIATSYNNLGALYNDQGRYSEAEPLHIKALELRKRLLGEEHPAVATSYNDLALLYKRQGRYSEAKPLYIKALSIDEKSLGVNNPITIRIRKNLKSLLNNYT